MICVDCWELVWPSEREAGSIEGGEGEGGREGGMEGGRGGGGEGRGHVGVCTRVLWLY